MAVLFGQLWMFCLLGAMFFLFEYSVVYIKGRHAWQTKRMSSRASIDADILDTYVGHVTLCNFEFDHMKVK